MKRLLFSVLSVFLLQACSAQVLQVSSPESAGVSSGKIARIDSLLQAYVDQHLIGGATAIVVRNGKIVYYQGIGYHDLRTKSPISKTDVFRIASQTKAITAVAVMILVDEGKLKLSDPVSKFLPEYRNQMVLDKFNTADSSYTTVPAIREVTIKDLLTHTSGIGYAQIGSKEARAIYFRAGIPGGIGVYNISLADKMRTLGTLPLMHQPGAKWTYGLNMDLLGYVVEVISGLKFDQFLQQKIFAPLGMVDTYFYLPKAKYGRLVALNTEDSAGHAIPAPDSFDLNGVVRSDFPATEGTYFSGGGGLASTAYDYAIFMQMLLNKGEYNGKHVLKAASVDSMTVDQYPALDWPDMRMGLGFGLYTEKTSARSPVSPGSYEWGGMFSSTYWVDPKEKIVAQLFINQYPHTHEDVHDKFKQLVYEALKR